MCRCQEFASGHYLFCNPAYPKSPFLLSPFDDIELILVQTMFNNRMSSVRESVEWGFADILRLWASLDFVPSQRLFLNLIGVQFSVSALLTDIHICIYGS
ncbi:hypothetical protein FPQ18DRAFT_259549 [Pyronema domesticum]|nr:hypothetical protein FPQ18DRAFT_259549 [Pyronema domesticum]